MDAVRLGLTVRALRRRRRLRQVDLATLARVSQSQISLVERGHVDGIPLATLVRVAKVLDARVEYELRWRGGALDRLLDERHAALVAAVATLLRDAKWEVGLEVTYSRFRDAGSIDVLAWRSDARALLIVEVKSEIASVEETLRKHDEKVRVAPAVARERFG